MIGIQCLLIFFYEYAKEIVWIRYHDRIIIFIQHVKLLLKLFQCADQTYGLCIRTENPAIVNHDLT